MIRIRDDMLDQLEGIAFESSKFIHTQKERTDEPSIFLKTKLLSISKDENDELMKFQRMFSKISSKESMMIPKRKKRKSLSGKREANENSTGLIMRTQKLS